MPKGSDNAVMFEKLNRMHDDINEVKISVGIQNGRVSKLEQWRSYFTGGLGVIVFLLAIYGYKLFGG